jgi:hypothetical protein
MATQSDAAESTPFSLAAPLYTAFNAYCPFQLPSPNAFRKQIVLRRACAVQSQLVLPCHDCRLLDLERLTGTPTVQHPQ